MGDDRRAARCIEAGRQAPRTVRPLENLVDELKHLRRRTPGDREIHADEVPPGAAGLLLQRLSMVIEQMGRRALERKDRLLFVADDEHRALEGAFAPVDTGKELARQRPDDRPLFGRSVLRLVHQDVIDAAVELEQHPGGLRRIVEQRLGAFDQVREVQRALRRLRRLIGRDVDEADDEDVEGQRRRLRRAHLVPHLGEARLLSFDPRLQ